MLITGCDDGVARTFTLEPPAEEEAGETTQLLLWHISVECDLWVHTLTPVGAADSAQLQQLQQQVQTANAQIAQLQTEALEREMHTQRCSRRYCFAHQSF